MTTQSSPSATAISVMLGLSSVTHMPTTGWSAASLCLSFMIAVVFMYFLGDIVAGMLHMP